MPRTKKNATPPAEAPETDPPAPAIATLQLSNIQTVPLGRLIRAPENVRQHHDDSALDELAADILGHGLLQSLIGYDRDEAGRVAWETLLEEQGFTWRDPEEDAHPPIGPLTFIVGGGRRLAALDLLRDRGAVDDAFPVPVLICRWPRISPART
jgi:ParB family chromosome partitioning protein